MPTTRIRNQFSFPQAWYPQQELKINSLFLRPDAHNASGAGGRLQQLEEDFFRLAGKKTWDSQFVWPIQHAIELYVSYEEKIWGIFNVAEAGVEGGAVCLVVDHRRGVEQQSELEQVSDPIDPLHNWLFWNYRDKGYSNGTLWWT